MLFLNEDDKFYRFLILVLLVTIPIINIKAQEIPISTYLQINNDNISNISWRRL